MSYLSVSGETLTEQVIEKSRFITTSRHVESEEEAKAFIEKVRKSYVGATHNCYAYIADEKGNFMRFSDDGEPKGTAGMPMLEVIKNNGLRQVAVVVTRYFGGIKLGAGGLLRAYSGSVAQNLAAAQIVRYEPCVKSAYVVDYPLADEAARFIQGEDCTLINCEYADRVTYTVAVKKQHEEEFNSRLLDRLRGRAEAVKLEEYLFPFKV